MGGDASPIVSAPKSRLRTILAMLGGLFFLGLALTMVSHNQQIGAWLHARPATGPKEAGAPTSEANLALAQLAYEERQAEADALVQETELDALLPASQHAQQGATALLQGLKDYRGDEDVPEVTSDDENFFNDASKGESDAAATASQQQESVKDSTRSHEQSEHERSQHEGEHAFESRHRHEHEQKQLGDEVIADAKQHTAQDQKEAKVHLNTTGNATTGNATAAGNSTQAVPSNVSDAIGDDAYPINAEYDPPWTMPAERPKHSVPSDMPPVDDSISVDDEAPDESVEDAVASAAAPRELPGDAALKAKAKAVSHQLDDVVKKELNKSEAEPLQSMDLSSEEMLQDAATEAVEAEYGDAAFKKPPLPKNDFLKEPTEFGPWLLNR
jgi:hypothetical protein